MSERQLIEAFDRLKPSEAAKQRMLDAILAADAAPVPPPVSARPRKPSNFQLYVLPVAACLVLLAGVGLLSLNGVFEGFSAQTGLSGAAQPTEPPGTAAITPSQQPTQPTQTTTPGFSVTVTPGEPGDVEVTSTGPVVVEVKPGEPADPVTVESPGTGYNAMPTPSSVGATNAPMMEGPTDASPPGAGGDSLLPMDTGIVLAAVVVPLLALLVLLLWHRHRRRKNSTKK